MGVRSNLGRANWRGVWGWISNADDPAAAEAVEILVDGELVGRVVARDPRPGLKLLAEEHRNCGFEFLFPNGLSALTRHVVRVRRATDGVEIEGSPVLVETDPGFTPALEQTVGVSLDVAIAGAAAPPDLDAPLRLVAGQIEHLLKLRRSLPGGDAAIPAELAALQAHWIDVLEVLAEDAPPAADAGLSRRALVVGDLAAVMDQGAQALLAHMRSLRRLGLQVEFAAAAYPPETAAHVAAIEAAGVTVCRPPLYPTIEGVLQRNHNLFDVVMLHRVSNFAAYAALARRLCPRARLIFSVDSLLHVRVARRSLLQDWPGGRERAAALRLRETMAAWDADVTVTHSAFEAQALQGNAPNARVAVVQWPVAPAPVARPWAERSGVAFIGAFQDHADLDAAAWLVEVLMPAVWRLDGSIRCVIAGPRMPEVLRTLQRENIEIVTSREMAADPTFAVGVLGRVRLSVSPMRSGAGLVAAVIDSLAAGVPCVATPVAVEALTLPDALARWVGRSVDELAAMICDLHGDQGLNDSVAEAGLEYVAQTFSEAAIDERMLSVVGVAAPEHADPVLVPGPDDPRLALAAD